MLKRDIIALLEEGRFDGLLRLSAGTERVVRALISLTYDKKSLVCWRAIDAIGYITRETSKTRPEYVRNLIGRLLWMIRDESGGIGWSSPEILGEIVRNDPGLFSDVAPVIASFLDEDKLCSGVLRAIGRIGEFNPMLFEDSVPSLISLLASPDNTIRGNALWALARLGKAYLPEDLDRLLNDENYFEMYEDGELREKRICDIAAEAAKSLQPAS